MLQLYVGETEYVGGVGRTTALRRSAKEKNKLGVCIVGENIMPGQQNAHGKCRR